MALARRRPLNARRVGIIETWYKFAWTDRRASFDGLRMSGGRELACGWDELGWDKVRKHVLPATKPQTNPHPKHLPARQKRPGAYEQALHFCVRQRSGGRG